MGFDDGEEQERGVSRAGLPAAVLESKRLPVYMSRSILHACTLRRLPLTEILGVRIVSRGKLKHQYALGLPSQRVNTNNCF